MCRTQGVLALIALSVGLAQSWDFAVTAGVLHFYDNGTITQSDGEIKNMNTLVYDAVNNILLFVSKDMNNATVYSYNISTKKYQPLFTKNNIDGIAFDPVKELLFWTDKDEKSIYKSSFKPGSKNNVTGNLLIKMDDEIPSAIVMDSCRGYIYWINVNSRKNPTIERGRFDGSEREVVIESVEYMPVSLAIDQQTKKIYWDDCWFGLCSIISADLNGKNIQKGPGIKMDMAPLHLLANALTVAKDFIYWVDLTHNYIWQLSKNLPDVLPKVISNGIHAPISIAANYKVEDQTQGVPECEVLKSLLQKNSVSNNSHTIPTDVDLFCVHGMKVNEKSLCKCTPGYTGDRCDISECQNYCFQGNCSISDEGHPKCRCNTGYSGERCEVDVCFNYCLNNGVCLLNELNEPVCHCKENHGGLRCEAVQNVICSITHTHESVEKNLTLVDLLSKRQKTTAKLSVIVELESN